MNKIKFNERNKRSLFWMVMTSVLFSTLTISNVFAKEDVENRVIKENQVLELNKSLRSVIEENQKLNDRTVMLEAELERLRSEDFQRSSRYKNLQRDHDVLAKNVQDMRSKNREYSKRLETTVQQASLRDENSEILQLSSSKVSGNDSPMMDDYSDDMQRAEEPSKVDPEVRGREVKTFDLITKIDAFAEEDENLRADSSKAHYNMGNIYFNKGEYEMAAREYYQAVALMPDDPDAHYNLAFVSQEYLKDYRTALKHYQMYLYLNPKAKDRYYVKEQLLHIQLKMDSMIDSPTEEDIQP